MSTTEERSVQSEQPVQPEAQPTNMSVWTRRVLVRRLDPRVAEYVSMTCSCVTTALRLIPVLAIITTTD